MSYTILYQSVWVKMSDNTYTMFRLCGDNNVWETNRKRARSWGLAFACYTEAQVHDYYSSWFGSEFQELFKYHGKWVNDDKLRRMIKSGMKNAIQAPLFFSKFPVDCSCRVYDDPSSFNSHEELRVYAKSEDDFTEWAKNANALKTSRANGTVYLNCNLSYGGEPIKLPSEPKLSDEETVVIEIGKGFYIQEINPSGGYTYGRDFGNALVFSSVEDAREKTKGLPSSNSFKFISYEKRLAHENAKQYVLYNTELRWYVQKPVKYRVYGCYNVKDARHYTLQDAQAFIKKHGPKYEIRNLSEE